MDKLKTRRPTEELIEAYGEEDLAIEIAMEERMADAGRAQIHKQIQKARESGNESSTSYGQTLIAKSVEHIADGIRAFIARADSGGAGRRHAAVKYLKQADPEVAGYIAMRCVVDSITGRKQLLQRVAVKIGSRIEDEVRFAQFEEEDKKHFNRAQETAKKGTMYHRKKNTMAGYERRYSETGWEPWPESDRLHLGMVLVDMATGTGFVDVGSEVTTRRDTKKVLQPTAKLVEWIENEITKSEFLSPSYLPMAVKPMDWTTPFNGGYLTEVAQGRNTMVKTNNVNYLTEMADRADEMPAVYASLNALQSTRWQINANVHKIANELWEESANADPLPPREDHDEVQCPSCGTPIKMPKLNTRGTTNNHACFHEEETGEENLRQWKKLAFEVHTKNVSLRSKRMAVAKTLKVADLFDGYEAIYFPYQLDFRGRVYAIPSFNPQGQDLTKGLIHFADGMAIEDGVAAGWLAIHGANVFGYDKASLEDRIQWVEDHEAQIEAVAADPIADRWWAEADKPWQFLAFCFEWAEFLKQGYGFVSYLPVALDGSCSGIQHFSAMLKDPVGGEAVNLVPRELPADIYQRVCDKALEKLRADAEQFGTTIAEGTPPTNAIADGEDPLLDQKEEGASEGSISYSLGWLSLDPNRKTTKRQVMTLPYGSTKFSCREYTEVWLKERLDEGYDRPWPKHKDFEATRYMSDIIWDSIREVVHAARAAMDWLQSCAKVVAKEELPVYWTTPSGFPVMQQYKNTAARRVKTKLGDQVVKLTLSTEVDSIDKRRMANAISPNFVHSLDATHLVMSTDIAADNGIHHFAMIHDSFGTHAAQTEKLAACLREAFVELYHGTDVLEDFRQQILRQVEPDNQKSVKPVPAKGDLDVSTVRESEFFFA